jgi:hypothetical protein
MRLLAGIVCLIWFALPGFSQSDRGTITGTVSDPAGAVVPNAPITARNTGTGIVYSAAASGTGNYTIAQLPVGAYDLSVSVPGFKKFTRQGLTVEVAAVIRIDIMLEVGAATESVTVTEAAPLLNTETGDLRHNVSSKTLDDLPILGLGSAQAGSAGIRNPNAMVQLIPGTYWSPNSQLRVNGTPNNTQSFRIEGQDASNTGTPGVAAQTQPSVDAVQEVAIQTSNYAAEYGQVGGGMFNLTMKSGTNQFHGSAYDYYVNEFLNAGIPFTGALVHGANPRPRNRRNDYGFTFGGPVWIPKLYNGRDKTFFFFNFEQYREHVAITNQVETVATDAYKAGNFATAIPTGAPILGTDPLGRPIYQGEIYDPNTTRSVTTSTGTSTVRDQFPNNVIPATRFDPVAVNIQKLFPEGLGANANGIVNNYIPNIPTTRVTEIPSIKIDQVTGSKGRLSFFYQRTKTTAPLSFTFGNVNGLPDPLPTNLGTFQNAPTYRLNYDYTLTPTVLLHFGGGYRSNYFFTPTVDNEGNVVNYNAEAGVGLKGGTTHRFFPPFTGLCTPGSSSSLGVAASTTGACSGQGGMQNFGSASYTNAISQVPSFNTSLSWVRGNHSYKFGGEIRFEGYPAQVQNNTSGSYGFTSAMTSLPYLNGQTVGGQAPGFAYASFLLGLVNNISIANPVNPRLGKHQLGLYAQDSWKITRKITFDYGIRYDYSTYLQEEHGRDPFFSPTTPNPAVGGILGAMVFDGHGPGKCNCYLANNYPLAFAPRLGIAWQLNAKTVFRAGFGIVYGSTASNNNASGGLAGSSSSATGPNSYTPVTTLAVGIPASFNPAPWPNYNPGQFNVSGTPVSIAGNPFLDPNAGRPPRQYQWSIGFEREILRDLAVTAAYVGNRGIWWQSPVSQNINAISQQDLAAHGLSLSKPADVALLTMALNSSQVAARGLNILPYPTFPVTGTLGQSLRPFPQFTTINAYWAPLGDTWYNSLQVKATQRFSHGLTFVSTFVWQKSLVNGTEIGEPNPGTAGNAYVNDVFNRNQNKYLSQYDQPFSFNISLTYKVPRLNTNKVVSYVLRDWAVGVFAQYSSGLPLLVPYANNNLGAAIFNTYSSATAGVLNTGTFANRVAGQPLYTVDINCHCFDPNKTFVLNPLAWSDPPAGQFGTSPAFYSDFRSQRRPVENFNFGRTWAIKERFTFNIRAEFTNIFNRAFIGNPTTTNATAKQTLNSQGNNASGFGYVNTITTSVPNAAPRSGTLVGRFTF